MAKPYLTTGDYDYFVKVAVESTTGHDRFLREKLYRDSWHTRQPLIVRIALSKETYLGSGVIDKSSGTRKALRQS